MNQIGIAIIKLNCTTTLYIARSLRNLDISYDNGDGIYTGNLEQLGRRKNSSIVTFIGSVRECYQRRDYRKISYTEIIQKNYISMLLFSLNQRIKINT